MASTTKGSIKISTANGIGAALVDVLGGEGYKPNEWEQSINICGIHAADIESALENIEEDAGTGAERGSILLSTANAIGATLNKKFNTSRGFKPKEWASAVSKLEPLPERTASGAIASFSDGADGVPVKSCSVSFLPSGGGGTPSAPVAISGVSGLSVTNHGKNYISTIEQGGIDVTNGKEMDSNTRVRTGFIRVAPNTQYTCAVNSSNPNLVIFHILEYGTASDSNYIGSTNVTIATKTFTTGANTNFVRFTSRDTTNANITPTDLANWQMEKGSSASSYSAYTPSVVTDTFGQTIYGGTRDLTTDKASVTHEVFTLDGSDDENYSGTGNRVVLTSLNSQTAPNTDNTSIIDGNVCSHFPQVTNNNTYSGILGFSVSASEQYTYIYFSDGSQNMTAEGFKTWLQNNPITLVLKVKTPTEITGLTPHEIDTLLGDNNIYADTGTTAAEYRADIDAPEPEPGNLLGMNSRNNNENEEESEG